MSITSQVLLVCSNAPSLEVAKKIAAHLLEHKLAACVNILPHMHSMYHWEGVLEEATEVAMQIKTTQACYSKVEAVIQALHPYTVPEIIALTVTGGAPAYLDWVRSETNKETNV
jgi:periplasmic divalent cation tolerance protein